jgi:hypothetical protein
VVAGLEVLDGIAERRIRLALADGLVLEGAVPLAAESIGSINALFARSLEYPPVVRQPSICLRRDIGRNPSLSSRGMVRRRR